jgi:putative FmdB family regulatory protein
MPIYEYRCAGCGREFELLVRSSTIPACPECGGRELKKKLSAFAIGGHDTNSEPAELCNACGRMPGSCATDFE